MIPYIEVISAKQLALSLKTDPLLQQVAHEMVTKFRQDPSAAAIEEISALMTSSLSKEESFRYLNTLLDILQKYTLNRCQHIKGPYRSIHPFSSSTLPGTK